MIRIDGTPGGGSILRISVPLAMTQNEAIQVTNIRKTRKKPGLRLQHLLGLQALCTYSGYSITGGKVGSTDVVLEPQAAEPENNVHLEVSTAASISLIFQSVSNLAFASTQSLSMSFAGGGTHTRWAPNFDYLVYVTTHLFEQFGQSISVDLDRLGYYPKGGARGTIHINQAQIGKVTLSQHRVTERVAISRASSGLKQAKVAERQMQALPFDLDQKIVKYDDTKSVGSAITMVWRGESTAIGLSSLGRRGLPAEKVSENIITEYNENNQFPVTVDNYMADQLLVPLSFSQKGSSFTFKQITDHVETNLHLINHLMDNVLIVQPEEDYYRVTRI